jgi:hypothetical protein
MKKLVLILLLFGLHSAAVSAQDSSANKRKVIAMLLEQSHTKLNAEGHDHLIGVAAQPSAQLAFRSVAPIPRYCLAKGAVICRLEEYVQLHSPFKLNIGVGGE